MRIFEILAGPVIGAVIGYITNDIAIRMLFRPHKAVYLGSWRLPFTPGIVPRRKDQLAKILGSAIVEKFFNADDLEIVFTDGIADAVAERTALLLRSDARLSGLQDALPPEAAEKLESELCIRIQAAICTAGLPEKFAEQGAEMLRDRLGSGVAGQRISDAVTAPMAKEIEDFVIEHGREFLLPLLRQEAERIAGQPVGDITALIYGEDDAALRAALKSLYLRFMAKHVRPIVERIDVGGMITEKIIEMSSEEVEELVLAVVKRELRMVVWFGALLGAVIGAVNIFI